MNFKEQVDKHIKIRKNKKKQAKYIFKYGVIFFALFVILFLFNLMFNFHKEYIDDIYMYRLILVLFILSLIMLFVSYLLSEKVYKLQDEHLRIEKNSVLK